jgi:hypothetical protein
MCVGGLSVKEQAALVVINSKLKERVKRQYGLGNPLSIHNGSSTMSNTPFGIEKRKKKNMIFKTENCKDKRLDNHFNRQLLKFSCKEICEYGQVLFKSVREKKNRLNAQKNKKYQAFLLIFVFYLL